VIKVKTILFLLYFSILLLFSCQKRLFGKVEVHGRIVNYYTGEPMTATVALVADDVTSAKNSAEASITLDKETTKSDGTFSLKSRPSKRGRYYLWVNGRPWEETNSYGKIDVSNGVTELGDIKAGTYTFYCNITLVPVSDSCIDIRKSDGSYASFAKGTSTVYNHFLEYSYKRYRENGGKYRIDYQKSDCIHQNYYNNDFKYFTVELPLSSAVLSSTISY
jgi:hypothetical protein